MRDEKAQPERRLERRVRRYPLDVMDCSGEEMRCYMSRGHHDSGAFLDACAFQEGEPLDEKWSEPAHGWWRAVPDPYGPGLAMSRYVDAHPGSRGAFPVTFTER